MYKFKTDRLQRLQILTYRGQEADKCLHSPSDKSISENICDTCRKNVQYIPDWTTDWWFVSLCIKEFWCPYWCSGMKKTRFKYISECGGVGVCQNDIRVWVWACFGSAAPATNDVKPHLLQPSLLHSLPTLHSLHLLTRTSKHAHTCIPYKGPAMTKPISLEPKCLLKIIWGNFFILFFFLQCSYFCLT